MEKKSKVENEKKVKKVNKISFSKKEIFTLIFITILVSFIAGYKVKRNSNSTNLSSYEKELIDNYRYITKKYYQDVDSRELISSAIKGMIAYLNIEDPYASYIDSEYMDEFDIEMQGSYDGLGVQISYTEDKEIVVIKVFENSPAKNAGLEVGDIIIGVDGQETKDNTLEDLKTTIKSKGKEEFKIKVRRNDQEIETTIKSGTVEIETVSSKIIDEENKIGYIKLESFANNSYERFKRQLEDLESNKIESLIVDL